MPPRRSVREIRAEWNQYLRDSSANNWRPKCFDDPIPYTELKQTRADAQILCAGCPLKALHKELAFAEKADGIVAGGEFFVNGRPVSDRPRRRIAA